MRTSYVFALISIDQGTCSHRHLAPPVPGTGLAGSRHGFRTPRSGGRRALLAAAAALAALGLLLWWLLPLGGPPAPSGQVTLSTGVRSGVYARYGELLKQDLGRDLPQVDVRLMNSAGSLDNLNQLAKGHAQFTIATADAVAEQQRRDPRAAARLRACARLYDDYIALVVPAGSPSAPPGTSKDCGSVWAGTAPASSWSPGIC